MSAPTTTRVWAFHDVKLGKAHVFTRGNTVAACGFRAQPRHERYTEDDAGFDFKEDVKCTRCRNLLGGGCEVCGVQTFGRRCARCKGEVSR